MQVLQAFKIQPGEQLFILAAVYIQLNYAFILINITLLPRYFNYMHYIADNVNGAMLGCELGTYLDLMILHDKSKHYSCHTN